MQKQNRRIFGTFFSCIFYKSCSSTKHICSDHQFIEQTSIIIDFVGIETPAIIKCCPNDSSLVVMILLWPVQMNSKRCVNSDLKIQLMKYLKVNINSLFHTKSKFLLRSTPLLISSWVPEFAHDVKLVVLRFFLHILCCNYKKEILDGSIKNYVTLLFCSKIH